MREKSYRHWCVDWANDMLVDERHFQHEQAYVESLVGWGLSQTLGTFGLVNLDDVERNLALIVEEVDPQRRLIRLTCRTCIGITPDGLRVFVRGDLRDEYSLIKEFVLERMDCRYDILVRVDPAGNRAPRQSDDPDLPLASPAHELLVEPHRHERVPQAGICKVGELEARSGIPTIDENYIPPCTGIRCHPMLQSTTERFYHHFERIRRNSLKIALSHRMGQQGLSWRVSTDNITEVFEYLCDHLAIWLGGNIDQLQLAIKMNRPPTTVFVFTRQFFRLFDAILDAMGGKGRIAFYEKWDQWNVKFTKKATFDDTIHRILENDYDHINFWSYLFDVESLLGPFDDALEAVVHSGQDKASKPAKRDSGSGLKTWRDERR